MKEPLIKTLSKRTLFAVAFILVGYVAVLGYVAIETERDVQFWPPRIGPKPSSADAIHMTELKFELDKLRSDVAEVKTILNNELVSLNARLADARKNMAEGGSIGGRDNYEWRQNIRSYEKDIHDIQDDVISRFRKLEYALKSLGKSCIDFGPINE
jgi:hypothetical protein